MHKLTRSGQDVGDKSETSQSVRTLAMLVCLGMILIYPVLSVPVQGATGVLAQRFGEITARVVTEGVIWSYAVFVLGMSIFADRRILASIGLGRPTLGTVLWGLSGAVALLGLGGLASFVTYTVLHQPNHSPAQVEALIRGSLIYALFLALRAGVIEELLYRGLSIEQLTFLTGSRWFAASISTLAFVLLHALRFNPLQLIPIAVASCGFAGLYLWRRNILMNMIAHSLIDAVAFAAVALRATSLY